jgi:hypothetical protein
VTPARHARLSRPPLTPAHHARPSRPPITPARHALSGLATPVCLSRSSCLPARPRPPLSASVSSHAINWQAKLAGYPEPLNIISCAGKIFAHIVEAHKPGATVPPLDFGDDEDSSAPHMDFSVSTTAPQPLAQQSALEQATASSMVERSKFYTSKFPPRVGGIGESAASRFALRQAGLDVKRSSLKFALPAAAQAGAEQPSLLVRHSDSCLRGNEFMRNPAELAEGIRAVERQLTTAILRDDMPVMAATTEPTQDGDAVSGVYRGSLPKPEIVRGCQYGLPPAAMLHPVGWRMQALFPTSIKRGSSMELRFHPGFIFEERQLPAMPPRSGLELHVHCLFRDQTEEWVTPEASDTSLCFVKDSSKSPRVPDAEVDRARRMYRG